MVGSILLSYFTWNFNHFYAWFIYLSKQLRNNTKNKLPTIKNKVRNLITSRTDALIVHRNGTTVLQ